MIQRATGCFFICLMCLWSSVLGASTDSSIDIIRHDISLLIRPGDHTVDAADVVAFETNNPGRILFCLGVGFEINKLLLDGRKIPIEKIDGAELRIHLQDAGLDEEFSDGAEGFHFQVQEKPKHVLEIHYSGFIYDTLKVPDYSRGTLAEETTGIIGEEGVFLSPETHWYPDRPDDYAFFSIKVTTPDGVESLTEGRRVARREIDNAVETEWDISYPSKGIYLVAGRYIIKEVEADGVKILGYFFPSEKDLIDGYLEASSRYVAMYNKVIGPYPFSKFAVVENFFPTGYGMPSFTLLGRRVIRLPFIVHTSLGHEVAHNWWGNSVYVDYEKGNWCEGLTVYFADYRYKEAKSDSAALDYRRTANIDYTTYVNTDNDFPLCEFLERTTPASRSIGYGKCAMVFHMLRQIVGEETFFRTFCHFYEDYRFKEASWEDIRELFERISGKNLEVFFDQWVKRKGAPTLSLGEVTREETPVGYRVNIGLEQDPVFELFIPVAVFGEDSTFRTSVFLANPAETFTIDIGFEPRAVAVDPGHDVFRRLGPREIPPTISGVLGDERAIIALPSRADEEKRAAFRALADQLCKTGEGRIVDDSMVTESAVREGAVFILGGPQENTVHSLLGAPDGISFTSDGFSVGGIDYPDTGHSAFITFRNPLDAAESVCVVTGNGAESIQQSGHKIIHYGKYSYVTFLNGKRLKAGVFPVKENPLYFVFEPK